MRHLATPKPTCQRYALAGRGVKPELAGRADHGCRSPGDQRRWPGDLARTWAEPASL